MFVICDSAEIKSKTVYSRFSALKERPNYNQGDIHLKENLKIISALCMQLLTEYLVVNSRRKQINQSELQKT